MMLQTNKIYCMDCLSGVKRLEKVDVPYIR